MNLINPGRCRVDLKAGALEGFTNSYVKYYRDLVGLYQDEAEFSHLLVEKADTVAYRVTEYRPSTNSGDMIFGVTHMEPGKVGGEFYMTRGHIHAKPNRTELYCGEAGQGVMLLESPAGEIRTVEISPRSICYVPPYWIHRSVNVGKEPLVMTFAYPADSGQDYDIIAKAGGMRSRIVDDGRGAWQVVDNVDYRPRQAELVSQIMAIVE